MSARFLALEGVDGSGKSTQADLLAEALRDRGLRVVTTREPGGTSLGEGVRTLVLDVPDPMSPIAEALLFAAARAQHVHQVIQPALADGHWVVCDRFVDSSLAYQGAARGLGIDRVWELNAPAVAGCLPDLALVIDLDAATAMAREAGPADRIESEGVALQRAVADGYRELAARFPERVRLVSGDGTPADVHERVMNLVEELL